MRNTLYQDTVIQMARDGKTEFGGVRLVTLFLTCPERPKPRPLNDYLRDTLESIGKEIYLLGDMLLEDFYKKEWNKNSWQERIDILNNDAGYKFLCDFRGKIRLKLGVN